MLRINTNAKLKVNLTPQMDSLDNIYHIGALQFAGTLNTEYGNTVMIFTSEDGAEELQLSPIDYSKKSKNRKDIIVSRYNNKSKIVIPLDKVLDKDGNTFYVCEWHGIGSVDLTEGLFFAIFTAKDGKEELQITKLTFKDGD
jgi:hypothetical protein